MITTSRISESTTRPVLRPRTFALRYLGAIAFLCVIAVSGAAILACAGLESADDNSPEAQVTEATAATFSNPRPVSIRGYKEDAMEPFLSRDGTLLFFNNSNDPKVDTNLYWASKVDDLTFQFQGEIGGVNGSALDAVASMDSAKNFYFITTRSYNATFSTVYSGDYFDGAVRGIGVVPGVSAMKRGLVDFDEEISADGNTLYFTEGVFSGGAIPDSSLIIVAHRSGNGFVRDPKSSKLLAELNNAGRLNYAACTSSNQLEIFFTRFNGSQPAIFMASRQSASKPFGVPMKIKAITGFVEAPTISPDGRALYYHKRNPNGIFSIYRVTRP